MQQRKFNTNDEQIRAESVHQANYNAAPGTPMRIVLAEALLVENYIRNGSDEALDMMRRLRDVHDQSDIAAYIGVEQAVETPNTETPASPEEIEMYRAQQAEARSADAVVAVSSPETRGEVPPAPVIVDEAGGVVETVVGGVDAEIHIQKPEEVAADAAAKTAFQKYQQEGLTNG